MSGAFSVKKQSKSKEIQEKKDGFLYHNRYVFLAFLVPFVLVVYGFYCSNFSPFGDNQVLVIDMWHQYFPFFNEFQTKLQSGGSMLHSWSGALGTNFIAVIAYYVASPLNLICILFPKEYLVECMALIIALKIALAGTFMCIYLRSMFKRCDISTVTFSMLYALCAYSMGYYWCWMWLDCLALLPLCMLGLNKLIDEGKFRLYTISLALILIGNYYIGVMVCIFIMCYYPILYFQREEAKGAKVCAITTVKAVLFSGIAIMLAAIILVPTYMSMQYTYYIDQKMPTTNTFYNPIMNVFTNLLPQVKLTVRGGLPNIYCGLISAMLGVMFLLCKKIPARKKILNCVILAFLVLSFNWNKLDFIWHGMHFPNELPYRYSFVFSFILVIMAYEAFVNLKDITPTQIGGTVAGGFIYVVLQQIINKDAFEDTKIYIILLFLALYGIALAVYKSGKFKEAAACVVIFLIAFGEMAIYTEQSVTEVGNSNKVTYYTDYDNIQSVLAKIEDKDNGFYRVEMNEPWTCNPGSLYGYRGVSQFSSEINSNVSYMMKYIGIASDPGSNSFIYRTSSPVTNAMLNIKYLFGKNTTINDSSLTPIFQEGGTHAYENKYPLSIAYGARQSALNWNYQMSNPIDVQENWITAVTGRKYNVYKRVADPVISGSNVVVGNISNGKVGVSSENSGAASTITLTYTAAEKGTFYAFIDTDNAQSISATTSNGTAIGFETNRGAISSIGDLNVGDTATITVNYEEGRACDFYCDMRQFDFNAWNEAYGIIASQVLNVTEHSDTYLCGDVTMKQDGVLMTSIPYSDGWTVKVDGETVEKSCVGDNALIAVELSAGQHKVEFSYMPEGFIIGVLLTILGIALLIMIYFIYKNQETVMARLFPKKAALQAETAKNSKTATKKNESKSNKVLDAKAEPVKENKDKVEIPSSIPDSYSENAKFDIDETDTKAKSEESNFGTVEAGEKLSDEEISNLMDDIFDKKN